MGAERLLDAGNKCLEDRENIPSAPLWHMGKVRAFHSAESFDLLQNTVDYLTCKAKSNRPFTNDEKEFMKEVFEALWWGGKVKGLDEAAMLADHYVNGNGTVVKIDSDVYTSSVIVADAMVAMRAYIRELSSKKRSFLVLKTSDMSFVTSPQARLLQRGMRNVDSKGYILKDGGLLAEQSNVRLKNTDNRFFLGVSTIRNASGNGFISTWSVKSTYDFEPFSVGYVTNIPLAEGFVLKLPDGLSYHLTTIGVAKDFKYTSEWREQWQ
jgi:hypothetical protein